MPLHGLDFEFEFTSFLDSHQGCQVELNLGSIVKFHITVPKKIEH